MYLSRITRRFALHVLPLLLAVAVLAPLAPMLSSPPVASSSDLEPASAPVDLFDFVRTERSAAINING